MTIRPPVAVAGMLLAAVATARDRGVEAPAATDTGPAVACIPLSAIRQTQVRSDRVIDFLSGHGRAPRGWRVTLPQGCPGLGFERRFGYETSLSSLCAGDIITVIQSAPVQAGARCGLAPFQPIAILPRDR